MTKFRLPVPPSTNNLYVNIERGRTRSKSYNSWLNAAGWELKIQKVPTFPRKVAIRLSCPRNKKRDLSNHLKSVEDLLVKHRVISDDKHVEHIEMDWHEGEADSGFVFVEVNWV